MNTCKTCEHWDSEVKSYYRAMEIMKPTDPDTYEPMVMPFEVNYCKQPLLLFCERPVVSNGACVEDGSTYYAALITAEDFGCVNWKERKA